MAKRKETNPTAFALMVSIPVLAAMFFAISHPVKTEEPVNIADIIEQVDAEFVTYEEEPEQVVLVRYPDKGLNNPGNLRDRNGNFRVFDTPEDGYQALVDDLTAKISGESRMMKAKLGNNYKPTIANIIAVYAPKHENNTSHYVEFVSEHTGIHPDQILTAADVEVIVQQMIVMEQGHKNAAIYKQYASN